MKRSVKATLRPKARVPRRLRKALRRGAKVEMEHTRSRRTAEVIASHHLAEFGARYYPALAKMERRLARGNPHLGNDPNIFRLTRARRLLERAILETGGSTELMDQMEERAYELALFKLQENDGKPRIIPVKERGEIRIQAILAMAQIIASGELHGRGPRRNPSTNYPAMTYAAAHKWEPLAAKWGVSEVARSSRGFMRAYQKARTFAALPEFWKRRREGFISRHMAQVPMTGENLWKTDRRTGKRVPSRRALALIQWAFMPPGR